MVSQTCKSRDHIWVGSLRVHIDCLILTVVLSVEQQRLQSKRLTLEAPILDVVV